MWVKGAADTYNKKIFTETSSVDGDPLINFGTPNSGVGDKLLVYFRNDDGSVLLDLESSSVVFDDIWHHILWTDTAGDAKLYIDGKLDETDFDYTPSVLNAKSIFCSSWQQYGPRKTF